ncbi:hypothetical protein [Micromonospora sp. DT233]|uniref:hypothetical protein n=1 Tax=Micromonospora sp. DT233 TaxID=3393432 RepID=UPI003CE74A96
MNHLARCRYVPVVTGVEIWGFEARRCGIASLALPWLATGGIIAASLAAAAANAGTADAVGLGMVRLVAMAFPITAGIAAVAAVGRERMPELQSTMPTPYPRTVLRRLVVVAAVTLLAATALVVVLIAQGQWNHPAHGVAAILVPLGPALLFIGAGAWATARLRSVGGASVVVIGFWFLQIFYLDRFIGVWQVNRALLSVAGVALAVLALRKLGASERLINGSRE